MHGLRWRPGLQQSRRAGTRAERRACLDVRVADVPRWALREGRELPGAVQRLGPTSGAQLYGLGPAENTQGISCFRD
jgi:hypothetical protein